MSVGQRIRAARIDAGLTQHELSRRAGLQIDVLGRLERGAVNDPHYSTISSIAGALGMTLSELLEDAGKALARSEPGTTVVMFDIPGTPEEAERFHELIRVEDITLSEMIEIMERNEASNRARRARERDREREHEPR